MKQTKKKSDFQLESEMLTSDIIRIADVQPTEIESALIGLTMSLKNESNLDLNSSDSFTIYDEKYNCVATGIFRDIFRVSKGAIALHADLFSLKPDKKIKTDHYFKESKEVDPLNFHSQYFELSGEK